MNDSVTAARTAREKLAQGLAALQSPGVPQQLMDVAEPIALAMSCLHRIEASQGVGIGDAGSSALNAVRRALAMLQGFPAGHPAVSDAIEAVAGSLSLIHAIGQAATVQAAPAYVGTVVMDHNAGPATQPSAAAYPQAPPQAYPGTQQAYPQAAPAAQQGYGQQPQWGAPAPAYGGQQAAYGAGQPQAAPPAYAAGPQQAPAYAAQPQPQPAWPQQAAPQPAWPAQPAQPAWPQQQPAPAAHAAPAAAAAAAKGAGGKGKAAGPLRVEAELGAHSSTNFYKGLSGNDVIDSGGIFIATYQIPALGQDLVIKVSMPGGYEFEAMGVVKWTRDAPLSGADAPPGFGAQFTQITPEGRQLVYRYVRNREPLFHDDL
jgi:hypothetical protein